MHKSILFIVLAITMLFSQTERVFIRNLKSTEIDSTTCATLTNLFSSELKSFQQEWDVITTEDVIATLEHGNDKELLDCEEESCIQKVGNLLGAPQMITGHINKVGSYYIINLSLINTVEGSSVRKASEKAKNVDGLIELLSPLALKIAGKQSLYPHLQEQITTEQNKTSTGLTKYVVRFESVPAGAVVMVDGEMISAKTPAQRTLTAGRHTIKLMKEMYHDYETSFTVIGNGQLIKKQLKPKYGFVTLTNIDSGLTVSIDGKEIGKTPVVDYQLPTGSHSIEIDEECYLKSSGTFTIVSGKKKFLDLKVAKKVKSVSIEAKDAKNNEDIIANLFRGFTLIGETPYQGVLPVCGGALVLRKKGYNDAPVEIDFMSDDSYSRIVAMTEGDASIENLVPQYGMKKIKGGTFAMGYKKGESSHKPVHDVVLSSFWMDSTEVTQKEFQRLMGYNPSFVKGDKLPVMRLSWFEAVLYCNERSKAEGLDTVYQYSKESKISRSSVLLKGLKINWGASGYRLPTEAEWEHACKAGSNTLYFWGTKLRYGYNVPFANKKPNAVASFKSNKNGLYDVIGNVAEWCHDYFDEEYYSEQLGANPFGSADPKGPYSGDKRVVRGGGYSRGKEYHNSIRREAVKPTEKSSTIGFRCVKK